MYLKDVGSYRVIIVRLDIDKEFLYLRLFK